MLAHAADLRAELRAEGRDPALADVLLQGGPEAAAGRLQEPWASLLAYAIKLTRAPADCSGEDIGALRRAGLDDRQVVDAVQVIAYFNYINRVADGLGVDLEPDMPPRA